jgi:hypothetical protein
MPSNEQSTKKHISYGWNDVLDWERAAKAEEERLERLAEERQTREAASRDFQEALNKIEDIDAEIQIKQEIVHDPNE